MKIGKRILIFSFVAIVVGIAAWITVAFNGLPWKEKAVAAKLENYLEEKYDQEFTLKESFYNFKDGSYGAWFYPTEDPKLEFYAEEGFAEYTYVDIYPEVLWARQLKEVVQPIAKEVYPEIEKVDTGYVTYESLDIVKGPDIPPFDKAGAMLSVRLEVEGAFSESDEQWSKVADLVEIVQGLSPAIDASFDFIDKKEGIETFITCPAKTEAEIGSVQQAKKSCSLSKYNMETDMALDD
ncbi:hypothetical protein D4T97_002295 [Siminovitchia acidinfaciens]|uniref:YfjL-like N-terminal domain-containing protein n=1 Tax=Siminovitchia acidinfaciens TaxID=2321395 RepID=A0A429Y7A6_9BACI|nr:hypothetical protein [Siminovitchia acidinfaciens]RST77339.1 hypothetical protein D4T97_002295 [Siminovitchia acidinfaciens]